MIPPLRPSSPVDLHLHSTLSDGRLAPDALLRACAEAGYALVALTDHDLAGEVHGPITVGEHTLHVLAAAEISGVHEGREFHLLVYFRDAAPEAFRDFCRERCAERAERYDHGRLAIGLPGLPAADDDARRGARALTRHHLARAIVQAGHAESPSDAFRHWLGFDHGHVPTVSLPFVDAIRIARDHGGLTSWAHPPLEAVEQHLSTFVAAGLEGLEGVRPHLNGKARKKYTSAARRHRLYLTGGSDWHGWRDGPFGLFRVDAAEVRGFLDRLGAPS